MAFQALKISKNEFLKYLCSQAQVLFHETYNGNSSSHPNGNSENKMTAQRVRLPPKVTDSIKSVIWEMFW